MCLPVCDFVIIQHVLGTTYDTELKFGVCIIVVNGLFCIRFGVSILVVFQTFLNGGHFK